MTNYTNDNGELVCAHCGFNYLHHTSITIYNRKEDSDKTTVTTVSASGSTEISSTNQPSNMCRNPSSRRTGLSISFRCENCHKISELTVAQQKGHSRINFVSV